MWSETHRAQAGSPKWPQMGVALTLNIFRLFCASCSRLFRAKCILCLFLGEGRVLDSPAGGQSPQSLPMAQGTAQERSRQAALCAEAPFLPCTTSPFLPLLVAACSQLLAPRGDLEEPTAGT